METAHCIVALVDRLRQHTFCLDNGVCSFFICADGVEFHCNHQMSFNEPHPRTETFVVVGLNTFLISRPIAGNHLHALSQFLVRNWSSSKRDETIHFNLTCASSQDSVSTTNVHDLLQLDPVLFDAARAFVVSIRSIDTLHTMFDGLRL